VVILGVILAIVGFVFGVGILWIIGIVAIIAGLCFMVAGRTGHAVGGRPHWW
jgi:hypothetical protein